MRSGNHSTTPIARREHASTALRCLRITFLIGIALIAAPVHPQASCDGPITVAPPAPTNATPIRLSFLGLHEICSTLTYAVTGNTITVLNQWDCVVTPLAQQRELTIGLLPPGTYDVRVLRSTNDPPDPALACGTITVTAAATTESVPALSTTFLIALATGIGTASLIALGRTT